MKKHVIVCITGFLHLLFALILYKNGFTEIETLALTSSAFFAFTIGFIMGYWS